MSLGNRLHSASHSIYRRALFSLTLVVLVVGFGTIALHYIEGYSYLYAFFFMSMLATGQGPPIVPVTDMGKLFTSLMAFVAVGTTIFSLGFLFGPVFARIVRASEEKLKEEEKMIIKKVKEYEEEI
ncbi:MAG: hypothetical protein KGH71_06060 [Candidatus Micrarchaeota archaeon]|nr:hypothetical protein [Candidatus Micrarchaeota archaeon]